MINEEARERMRIEENNINEEKRCEGMSKHACNTYGAEI